MFEHPLLLAFLERYGPAPFHPHPVPQRDPFRVLAESIVAQQLSTQAAKTIAKRLWEQVEPRPEAVLQVPLEALRQAGLSLAKAMALKDLAAKAQEGLLEGLEALEDGAVKARLQEVRGVGPWTAEMFLMFGLGRPDVWPVGDLGLRRAAKALFGVEGEALAAFGAPFRPYRSHLAWYLWRSLD
ncbi:MULTISPECIES: DNA-3-methyladenine glycosylase family protein [Thermus]|uniref:DNA-3-methyladenine glycosylase family protein n=1 Tax=Thermus TaxID=270 RepID=UPI001F252483|nr:MULTISPECIES: DNA-3-methyladenine glycosylase 2 family protein [Thermus]